MNASRPEADTEYSRGPGAGRAGGAGLESGAGPAPLAVVAGALVGAVLLVVAEFTPLLRVESAAYHAGIVETVTAGAHHSYALIPIALLAAALALGARATGNRLALASVAALGLVALGIALLGDLPDAHTSGLIRHVGGTYVAARSTPAIGLHLETLGAVVLLVAGGIGALLAGPGPRGSRGVRERGVRERRWTPRKRSAS